MPKRADPRTRELARGSLAVIVIAHPKRPKRRRRATVAGNAPPHRNGRRARGGLLAPDPRDATMSPEERAWDRLTTAQQRRFVEAERHATAKGLPGGRRM
ncbi:MAG TPA: hypothetical protein VN668_16195 [Stellaceae bacterium]|nr:hypothetical protein [Stellaceae bacterium]